MRYLFPILFLAASSFVKAEVVLFAGQVAQADIPAGYEYKFEEKRKTLVLLPQIEKKVEIRFTYNSLREYVKQRPTIGKDAIRDAARKKEKELFTVSGNDGVAFIDFTEARVANGEKIRSTHGTMGLNDGYVTFTITAAEDVVASDFVKGLLSGGIKTLLGSITSRSN